MAYICSYAMMIAEMVSFARLISWFTSRVISLTCRRWLPFHPFLDTTALPAAVFAPVDFSQGFHVRINSACLALRSGVHPFIGSP